MTESSLALMGGRGGGGGRRKKKRSCVSESRMAAGLAWAPRQALWFLRRQRNIERLSYKDNDHLSREPVWRSGKALGWLDLGSNLLRLSFVFKSCGLWTLSCDLVVPHN